MSRFRCNELRRCRQCQSAFVATRRDIVFCTVACSIAWRMPAAVTESAESERRFLPAPLPGSLPLDERRRRREARAAVRRALGRGELVRRPCAMKGRQCAGVVDAHHSDYSQPLKVRWLCRRHHQMWHAAHPEETTQGRRPTVREVSPFPSHYEKGIRKCQ